MSVVLKLNSMPTGAGSEAKEGSKVETVVT